MTISRTWYFSHKKSTEGDDFFMAPPNFSPSLLFQDVAQRFVAYGWKVVTVDANDVDALTKAFLDFRWAGEVLFWTATRWAPTDPYK